MAYKIILSVIIFIAFISCNNKEYYLAWEIPDEGLLYSTVIENIDSGYFKINDKSESSSEGENILNEMRSGVNMMHHFTIIKKINVLKCNITMISYIPDKMNNLQDFGLKDFFSNTMEGIYLNADVDISGKMISGGLSQSQQNLIALLFELPGSWIKIGDEWPIDVNFLSGSKWYNDAKYENKNVVKLKDVINEQGRSIAILEYDIFSSETGTYINPLTNKEEKGKYYKGFKAYAKFDLVNKKWKKFKGILYSKQQGMINWEQKVLIKLSEAYEIPADAINIIKGNYDFAYYDTLSKMIDSRNSDKFYNVLTENNAKASFSKIKITGLKLPKKKNKSTPKKPVKIIEENSNCPYIYSVQIASSKEKLSLQSNKFKAISNQVFEVVKPNEQYIFKYRVGKECSKKEALKLKKDFQNKGFKEAFIVKEKNKE